jgi:hypothetical protein
MSGTRFLSAFAKWKEMALFSDGPSPEESAMLDRELEAYRANPDAGSSWEEVKARLLKPRP